MGGIGLISRGFSYMRRYIRVFLPYVLMVVSIFVRDISIRLRVVMMSFGFYGVRYINST